MSLGPATLAIDGGAPAHPEPWPAVPAVEPASDAAPVAALEREFAAGLGITPDRVVALDSAAVARACAMEIVGATPGDPAEVLVPALLGGPWARATAAGGRRAVPVDVDHDTATISLRSAVHAASATTRGIVVAHAFGHPALMETLLPAAREHGWAVIEDGSDAVGGAYREMAVGTMGRAAVFALGAGHVLSGGASTPEGAGALLVLDDGERTAMVHGREQPMSDTAARIALAEWRGHAEALTVRRQVAWELTYALKGMRGVAAMRHGRWVHHGYDRYVVRLRGVLWRPTLEETLAALRAEGVPCEAAVPAPIHLDQGVRTALADDARLSDDRFTQANLLPRELVAMPLHAGLTSRDMDQVAAAWRKVEQWAM